MASQDLPDLLLVKECQKGSDIAFKVLFKRYYPRLFQYSKKMLANDALAEELVMDVLFWVWKKRDQLPLEGDFSAYLFSAMKNAIFSHFRKIEFPTISIELFDHHDLLSSRAADETFKVKELQERYTHHLEKLSPQRRRVFSMSRDEELSYSEIATRLNLSVKTVENHISSSLSYLRKNLGEYVGIGFCLLAYPFL